MARYYVNLSGVASDAELDTRLQQVEDDFAGAIAGLGGTTDAEFAAYAAAIYGDDDYLLWDQAILSTYSDFDAAIPGIGAVIGTLVDGAGANGGWDSMNQWFLNLRNSVITAVNIINPPITGNARTSIIVHFCRRIAILQWYESIWDALNTIAGEASQARTQASSLSSGVLYTSVNYGFGSILESGQRLGKWQTVTVNSGSGNYDIDITELTHGSPFNGIRLHGITGNIAAGANNTALLNNATFKWAIKRDTVFAAGSWVDISANKSGQGAWQNFNGFMFELGGGSAAYDKTIANSNANSLQLRLIAANSPFQFTLRFRPVYVINR